MSGSNPYQYQQTTSGGGNALYNLPPTAQRPQSSLLLNSVNLAWSQPNDCILVAPKPELTIQPTSSSPSMSLAGGDSSSSADAAAGQPSSTGAVLASLTDSPTSSVNTSELGKMSSVSSDFDRLSIADSTKTSTSNLDSVSHRAVAGSIESLGAMSSDSGSIVSSPSDVPVADGASPTSTEQPPPQPYSYVEVDYHWFYQKDPAQPDIWQPFSNYDSYNLEYAFRCGWYDTPISTNGTRYDVLLRDRTRKPVYWTGASQKVQRCSWFFKRDSDYRFVPYAEEVADLLESTYRECFTNNVWNRRVDLASHEFVIFYAADSVYHYISETTNQDGWGAMMETHMTPRYAYRGVWLTNAQKERDEAAPVEHVVFMVHGIGDFCDISFRKLVDVVDDFREISADLMGSHYGHEQEMGRVEVLPISWHSALHTDQLDAHLKMITLPSIPRIRAFTNDTIMDALFYTAPQHSQTIRHAVASELNRIYTLFLSRNPHFTGTIALGGHSLGSLILFDLLSHQASHQEDPHLASHPVEQLYFRPAAFFAFGSPIPVFLSVRGIHQLDGNFQLPTCPSFYNIFHPYDPIAYRIEPLIDPDSAKLKPVLVPHHKGRKRFHLEIKDSITRMGTELKEKVLTSIKGTLDSVYGFLKAHQRTASEGDGSAEGQQLLTESSEEQQQQSSTTTQEQSTFSTSPSCNDILSVTNNNNDLSEEEQALVATIYFGRLNSGRRIDYVLQERPIEIVNEYLFAIAAHGCYWLSEDTALLVLRELYGKKGCVPCFQEPQPQTASQSSATDGGGSNQTARMTPPGPPPPKQKYSELIQQTTLASTSPTHSNANSSPTYAHSPSAPLSPPSFTTPDSASSPPSSHHQQQQL